MKKQIAMLLASAALVLPLVVSAQGTTTKYKSGHQDLAGMVIFNTCNSSYVTMTQGSISSDYSYTIFGNQVKGNSSYTATGKGTGPAYGYFGSASYSFKNTSRYSYSYFLTGSEQQYKSTNSVKLDQKGPNGATYVFTYDSIFKVSATGEVEQNFINYSFGCQ